LTYIKQFDTVRAFAVFLVILSHWPIGLNSQFNLGSIGVTIFFVLSGFLITQILLKDKQKKYKYVSKTTNSLVFEDVVNPGTVLLRSCVFNPESKESCFADLSVK
jgi:hypothetical protein